MFHVSFPFDLAAGATLDQDFNIDFPTFGTSKGFHLDITSVQGGAVLLQLGTVDSTTSPVSNWRQYTHHKMNNTDETRSLGWPKFTWNYLNQEVRLKVTNLSSLANTYHVTCTSDDT
jgi:hypothetical protein